MSKLPTSLEFIQANQAMLNEELNPYGALEELQETSEFQGWIGDLQRTDRNLYRKIESEKLKLMVGLGDRKFERDGVYAYRYHGQPSAFRLYYGIVDSRAWLLWGDTKPSQRQQSREIDKAVELLGRLRT